MNLRGFPSYLWLFDQVYWVYTLIHHHTLISKAEEVWNYLLISPMNMPAYFHFWELNECWKQGRSYQSSPIPRFYKLSILVAWSGTNFLLVRQLIFYTEKIIKTILFLFIRIKEKYGIHLLKLLIKQIIKDQPTIYLYK